MRRDFPQEWVTLVTWSWWPRGILSPQSQESFISRTFCHTMTTLIDRIKLQTVARHQNDKSDCLPARFSDQVKIESEPNSAGVLMPPDSAALWRALVNYMGFVEMLFKRKRTDMCLSPVKYQVYKCQSLNHTPALCLCILSCLFISSSNDLMGSTYS